MNATTQTIVQSSTGVLAEHKTGPKVDPYEIRPFLCGSPSNPHGTKGWLSFKTEAGAQAHADRMNSDVIATYDLPTSSWNKEFWTKKPESWIVIKNPDYKEV